MVVDGPKEQKDGARRAFRGVVSLPCVLAFPSKHGAPRHAESSLCTAPKERERGRELQGESKRQDGYPAYKRRFFYLCLASLLWTLCFCCFCLRGPLRLGVTYTPRATVFFTAALQDGGGGGLNQACSRQALFADLARSRLESRDACLMRLLGALSLASQTAPGRVGCLSF